MLTKGWTVPFREQTDIINSSDRFQNGTLTSTKWRPNLYGTTQLLTC